MLSSATGWASSRVLLQLAGLCHSHVRTIAQHSYRKWGPRIRSRCSLRHRVVRTGAGYDCEKVAVPEHSAIPSVFWYPGYGYRASFRAIVSNLPQCSRRNGSCTISVCRNAMQMLPSGRTYYAGTLLVEMDLTGTDPAAAVPPPTGNVSAGKSA